MLYFEQRAKTYIEEVLVPALGISVFYYVMEFAWARRFRDQGAAGRGQIHFHLLGWLESGEPHHIMHADIPEAFTKEPDDFDPAAAAEAWRAAIEQRRLHDEKVARIETGIQGVDVPPAPLASRSSIPKSMLDPELSREEREQRWKAFVLERWLRERNIIAQHPADADAVTDASSSVEPFESRDELVRAWRLLSDPSNEPIDQARADATLKAYPAFAQRVLASDETLFACPTVTEVLYAARRLAFGDRERWPKPEGKMEKPPATRLSGVRTYAAEDVHAAVARLRSATQGGSERSEAQATLRAYVSDRDATRAMEGVIGGSGSLEQAQGTALAAERLQHAHDVSNVVRLHRCSAAYCLCALRHGPEGYRECTKGGFGPEAPLVNHMLEGPMRPWRGAADDGERGDREHHCGRGVRYDAKAGYYVVKLAEDAVAEEADAQLYICKLADARPKGEADGRFECPCADPRCRGVEATDDSRRQTGRRFEPCPRAPPMGKLRRDEPALVERNGVLTIELPRRHPRYVQGLRVSTEWWQGNDDQSIILCRKPPRDATAAELAEVARYVPGYMCKGGKGSSEYAKLFKTMLSDAEPDTPIKTLVRRLMIRICGNDYPRQQVAPPPSRPPLAATLPFALP